MRYSPFLVLIAFAIGFVAGYGAGAGECRIKEHTNPEPTKEIYL